MARFKPPLTFLALLTVLAGAASASASERIALVIGNGGYTGSIVALRNPVNDALDVSAKLKSLGWTVVFAQDATRKDFSRRLAEFADLLGDHPGATAVFYYAGHGVQLENKNYLLPIGEDYELPVDVKENAFGVDRVMEVFAQSQVSYSVVILDACRDSPFTGKSRSIGTSRGLTVVPVDETAEEGSAVIFATAPQSVAADGEGRNGIFTESLLKYLDQGHNLPDLFRLVRDEVKLKTVGKQIPSLVTSGLLADLSFSPEGAETAAAIQTDRQPVPEVAPPEKERPGTSLPGFSGISLSGWVAAGLGVLTTGGSLLYGASARQDFDNATSASGETLALNRLQVAGVVFTSGLVVTGLGVLVGLVAPFFSSPEVSK